MSNDFDAGEMLEHEQEQTQLALWIPHGRSSLRLMGPQLCKKKEGNVLRVDKIKPLLNIDLATSVDLKTLAAQMNEKTRTYEEGVELFNQGLKIKSTKRKRVVDPTSDVEETEESLMKLLEDDDEDDDATKAATPPRISIADQIDKLTFECTEPVSAKLTMLPDENRVLKNRLDAMEGMEAEMQRLRDEVANERQAKEGMEAEMQRLREQVPVSAAADKNKLEGFYKSVPLLKQRLARANIAMNEGNYDRAREQIEMVTELFAICDAYSSASS